MQRLSTRASWWMTAASFSWVWGLLSVAWPPRYALCLGLAVCFGVTTWVATRWPWPGVVLTSAGLVTLGLLGIGTEEPAPLGPLFIVIVTVSYLVPPRWSVLVVPVLLTATALPARWDPASVVFGGALLFLPWWFGVQVRVRDARRREAAEDLRRLTGVDPSALARQAAVSERDDVAASAFAVLGHAVGLMTEMAVAARESLDLEAIDSIHRKGEESTQRLRALLVLLRDEAPPVEAGAGAQPPAGPPARPERAGWWQAALGGWPALLILLDVVTAPFLSAALRGTSGAVHATPLFLLLVVLPLMVAVVVRDRWPVPALLGASVVLALGAVAGIAEVGRDGLWLMILAMALSWSAGRAGTPRSLAAWFVFTMTLGFLVWSDTPYYLPIYLAMEALPFGAAAVWSGHHAAETAHLGQAQARQAEIEAAERAAVSQERLHLARDLHDAASHAVGTMMMQANAARVLRERDPDGARAALAAVIDIGREAAAELRAIRGFSGEVPQGSLRSLGRGADGAGDVAEAIAPLVTAARRTGAHVRTDLDLRAVPSPEDVVLLLRVVREGLANAVRHAPGSEVTVAVSVTPSTLLTVVANGPARPDPRQDGAVTAPMGLGLGLRGLRELIGERQGELSAAATRAGFELRASFPSHHTQREAVVP
ncbi:histidine kinase [Ornithinimicrobium cavernae]|uniref:histidine kinase n=1 Tax=Ornithinimicrobium cavernae TaxID=2666047 RepID=UPI0012B17101|nr:histidine kinase [Ornithinimicrobium cavernae]